MSRAAELIDRATENPAYEGLGGYYIFIRRVAIPLLLIGVCMSSYYMSVTWFSHGTSIILAGMVTGLSLGPIMALEQMYGIWVNKK
ncbi:MAG: hypothetical protein CMB75_01010 [Euryarchaeota archaeon]|nr:hypothetical protein [Euryarchaeota archaeon]|tara:strand:- start:2094 stop:2351 length:258 start_codon:yes stop_codon:yes gene_type:complete